jgi:hypothetical protein
MLDAMILALLAHIFRSIPKSITMSKCKPPVDVRQFCFSAYCSFLQQGFGGGHPDISWQVS